MANYSAIKAAVNAYIKQNGKKEITGRILNSVLNATIDSLGRYFQFAGGAMPTDDPGTPDQNVCYLAGEPGVYTNFGGITVENEEVALLFWDGEWTKQKILIGIQEVDASVDNQVGTPSVDVSYSGGQLVLTFHNLKGIQGVQGDAAGFGTIGADVTGGVGTPGVSVETSGSNTSKNIMFHFTNLKGETGVTSVVATIDDTSGTPSCQVSLVNGVLTLAFSGLKGLKGDTGVSADYPITIYNGLDSDATDQALAAAQGKILDGKISQLGQEVGDLGAELLPDAISLVNADSPLYIGKYWSAGGVLSTRAEWRADTVNLINYRGKTITFCLGSINGDGVVIAPYNWIKKSDDSFVSLDDVMTILPRTKNAMFVVPDDAVELQVSWNAFILSSYNCVAYAQVDPGQNFYGYVDAISKTIGFTKSTPTYTLESGYWDIRNTPPSINTGVASAHTSPIALKKGDLLHFVISNGAGITAIMGAIVLVDSSGNSIASVIGGDRSKTDFSWRATQDCYISISYTTGFTLIKSIEIYNSSVIEEIFNEISEEEANPYSGKIWHCFGTSISNVNSEGKYPKYLAALSGMNQVNFGVSGGCIAASASGSKYILNAIKGDNDIADADIITIEGFVNDWSQNVPLGVLSDNSADVSFMGALNEAITYIQANSNAQIFFITDTTGREYGGTNVSRDVVRGQGLTQNDYIEATIKVCKYRNIPVIDAGRKSMISQDTADLYIIDQIHHTELGGYQFARVIWDEMKRFSPRALSLPE